jgi:hypothetical protein
VKKLQNQTLADLILGIIIYGIAAAVLVLVIAENKAGCFISLILGLACAVFLIWHMSYVLERAVYMGEDSAVKYSRKRYVIRLFVVAASIGICVAVPGLEPICALIGMLALKLAAYMQPLIHKYITTKIYKQGR